MAEWGRKEYKKSWPNRRPVWGIGAFFAATLAFAGMLTVQYERSWTAADGLYWKDYLKSGARSQTSARSESKYTLLEGMTAKGQGLFLKGDQVETVTDPDGRQGWRLTDAGAKLRRTCAKRCRKAGGDLEQIKLLLGHSSIQATKR